MNAASDASKRKKTKKSREMPASQPTPSRSRTSSLQRSLSSSRPGRVLSYMCEQALVVMHEKRTHLRAQHAHVGMRILHSNHTREGAFTRIFFSTMVQNENAKAALDELKLLAKRYAIDETRLAATCDRMSRITDPILSTMHALVTHPPGDAGAHTEAQT